jgi:7-cyano-7-deazaguanine reductase
MHESSLHNAPLGQEVSYPRQYDPALLFPIVRSSTRHNLDLPATWHGQDIWNAYELSWLNPKGKPVVAMGRFSFDHSTPCLIESKSFKLYLNSFNETRFADTQEVIDTLQKDLRAAAGSDLVSVELDLAGLRQTVTCAPMPGIYIDELDIDVGTYQADPKLLSLVPNAKIVTEVLTSDLLKSNCPVTGQPDWGSVQISYTGAQLDQVRLLAYIVSLRRQNEFHEHCVEKMYCDIWKQCRPEMLTVFARYTRRGGLDINPWRSNASVAPLAPRQPRQ